MKNHHVKYIGQRSFISKFIVPINLYKYTHRTNCSSRTALVVGNRDSRCRLCQSLAKCQRVHLCLSVRHSLILSMESGINCDFYTPTGMPNFQLYTTKVVGDKCLRSKMYSGITKVLAGKTSEEEGLQYSVEQWHFDLNRQHHYDLYKLVSVRYGNDLPVHVTIISAVDMISPS